LPAFFRLSSSWTDICTADTVPRYSASLIALGALAALSTGRVAAAPESPRPPAAAAVLSEAAPAARAISRPTVPLRFEPLAPSDNGSRVFVALGTISYGFYLWHVPVLLFLRGHGLLPLDPVLGPLAAFGPALAISALSWVAVERPVIDWAKRRNALARAEERRRLVPKYANASGGGNGGVDRRTGGREVGTVRA